MRTLMPLVVASVLGLTSPAAASPEEDAHVALVAWSEAYAARDHVAMSELHTSLARVRGMDVFDYIGREAISERFYFDSQKMKAQSVTFIRPDCQVFNDGNFTDYLTGLCSGTYEMRQTLTSGETTVRLARFSMALVVENNVWMISDHNTTWLPTVVADCGISIPPDKAAITSGAIHHSLSALCTDNIKTGSVGAIPRLVPAGVTTLKPKQ